MPIALANFEGSEAAMTSSGSVRDIGANIAQVVTADLERSGLFAPIDQRAFINSGAASTAPQFANWRAIGAQALVTGSAVLEEDGRVRVEF